MIATQKYPASVVFQPAVQFSIQRGIQQIVAPIRATLGPISRTVAAASSFPGEAPEVLDKGSIIARRIIALADRDADMGAMLVRSLLWRLHKTTGDSTATAAVLCQSIYDDGLHYLAAGGSPMRLRAHLEAGLKIMLMTLDSLTRPAAGSEILARVAQSVCHDAALSGLLGEIFDTIGPYAQVDVRSGHSRETMRQYVEGAYWKSGVHSTVLLPANSRVELENPAIVLTDLSFDDPRQIAPAIEAALLAGNKSLVLMANRLGEAVIAFLVATRDAAGFVTLAVKIPEPLLERPATLDDLSVLTGGRAFLSAAGDTLASIKPADLGGAAGAWADHDYLGLIEGRGDAEKQKRHIAALQQNLNRAEDLEQRAKPLERLGKFVGGSAVIWCGGAAENEIKTRKANAENAVSAVRAALFDGVLPGGGTALLACRSALRRCQTRAACADERAAYTILLRAAEAPFRTIVGNAGYQPGEALAALQGKDSRYGFDVTTSRVVDMRRAGIFDTATAYKAALQGAVTTAAAALTIDVLVHTSKPQQVLDPA